MKDYDYFLAAGFLAAGLRAAGFLAAGLAAVEAVLRAAGLAAGFLAAGFFAAGFLAAGLRAAGFLAAGFFAAVRLAAGLLAAVVLRAAGFLAAGLRAAGFLAAVFLAAVLRAGAAPGVALRTRDSRSLKRFSKCVETLALGGELVTCRLAEVFAGLAQFVADVLDLVDDVAAEAVGCVGHLVKDVLGAVAVEVVAERCLEGLLNRRAELVGERLGLFSELSCGWSLRWIVW